MKTPYYIRKVTKFGNIASRNFKGLEGRYLLIIPLNIKTDKEKNSFFASCRNATEFCQFGFLGKRCRIYTDVFTEHLKPMIPLIKNKVLEDCQKNPARYLWGDEKK